MVFAFNCVSVLLIYVELARYQYPSAKSIVDKFFKGFCDEREKGDQAFVVTHIFLLMG